MEARLSSHQAVDRRKQGYKPARSGILATEGESLSARAFVDNASFLFHHHEPIQMITLIDLIKLIGSSLDHALQYLEHHHWLFGFLLFAYLFRLHDRSVHARFSALDKRVDEVRKRLACDL
jgi:hypothetical protein